MNEQPTHWTDVNYSYSSSLTPEIQVRREIFESYMDDVDSEQLSKEAAIGWVERLTQTSKQAGRFALIDNPELFDIERR